MLELKKNGTHLEEGAVFYCKADDIMDVLESLFLFYP